MRDARPLLIALLLATPFACSHEGAAPEVANGASTAPHVAALAFEDSPDPAVAKRIAQPVPPHGTGGTLGSGGTLGTGGTGSGGIGPGAGTGGISTGGSIVH